MTDRAALMRAFLDRTDWAGGVPRTFTDDASNRRYFRVTSAQGRGAVLMDAPPDRGEDVRPFVTIAQWLRAQGLSAPEIYADDLGAGFLLLEDLGDDLYARVVKREPTLEPALYEAAVNVVVALAQTPPPPLAPYDAPTMGPLAGLAGQWYAGSAEHGHGIYSATQKARSGQPGAPQVKARRDYHAENLLWLPDRKGTARVGLLDFQDARAGHPAYDLASLLHDARRDVATPLQRAMVERFAKAMGWPKDDVTRAVAVQGAQRNLRILGVFARLSLHFSKPHYVDFIPRVWRNLNEELSHPALSDLRAVEAELPKPPRMHLESLKSRCGTIPTQA